MSQYNPSMAGPMQGPRTFTSAISICLSQYVGFRGRAPRSEYWYFVLFNLIVSIVAAIIDAVIGHPIFAIISGLGLFLPNLAVFIRRLHDTDHSGWWWWFLLVPIIGFIMILIWMCSRGTPGPNRYGSDALGASGWGQARAA